MQYRSPEGAGRATGASMSYKRFYLASN